jgi:hypothetical protein
MGADDDAGRLRIGAGDLGDDVGGGRGLVSGPVVDAQAGRAAGEEREETLARLGLDCHARHRQDSALPGRRQRRRVEGGGEVLDEAVRRPADDDHPGDAALDQPRHDRHRHTGPDDRDAAREDSAALFKRLDRALVAGADVDRLGFDHAGGGALEAGAGEGEVGAEDLAG